MCNFYVSTEYNKVLVFKSINMLTRTESFTEEFKVNCAPTAPSRNFISESSVHANLNRVIHRKSLKSTKS